MTLKIQRIAKRARLLATERIIFTGGRVAVDLAPTQSAGQTALLIGAVLPGRLYAVPFKQGLLGSVIDLLDQSFTL